MTNKYVERSLYSIIFLIIITLVQLTLALTGSKFLFLIIIESIVLGVFIILFVVSLTDYVKKDDEIIIIESRRAEIFTGIIKNEKNQ